jgi:hypothetical protein
MPSKLKIAFIGKKKRKKARGKKFGTGRKPKVRSKKFRK